MLRVRRATDEAQVVSVDSAPSRGRRKRRPAESALDVFEDRHIVVVGLGFGDEGKGATVDYLCSLEELGVVAVARFNGGAQAGHNVCAAANGRLLHHTFSQYGSGTLAGVPTVLGSDVLVDPLALAAETDALRELDPWPAGSDPLDAVFVDSSALVVSSVHKALGAAREDGRLVRHGTCGMGVGAAAEYALLHPGDAPRVSDCEAAGRGDVRELVRKLGLLRSRAKSGQWKVETADSAAAEARAFAAFGERVRSGDSLEHLRRAARRGRIVFEGAQGVLLDECRGFHPHTTWSTTTPANALRVLGEMPAGRRGAYVLGVTRSYLTRHGAGPLPTHDAWMTDRLREEHNSDAGPQGAFRAGELDASLLRYAVAAAGRVDGVSLTHLDAAETLGSIGLAASHPLDVRQPLQDLRRQEAMGQLVMSAPVTWLAPMVGAQGAVREVERVTGLPVVLTADGPLRLHRRLSLVSEPDDEPGPDTSRGRPNATDWSVSSVAAAAAEAAAGTA